MIEMYLLVGNVIEMLRQKRFRKGVWCKNMQYDGENTWEQKTKVHAVQNNQTGSESAEKKRTEVVRRYQIVEDENSVYEYDLNCITKQKKNCDTDK